MTRFKCFMDKDLETAWLNEMAADGWKLTGFFMGFYTFEACEKGKYTYQIDFYERSKNGSASYDAFMRELGITVVCTWFFWTYLCKETSDGPFELYSDSESRITHYTRIRRVFKVGAALEFCCTLLELVAFVQTGSPVFALLAILLGILGAVIARQALHTGNIIREMQGLPKKSTANSRLIISVCVLVNSILLLLSTASFADGNSLRLIFVIAVGFLCGIELVAVLHFLSNKDR